MKKMKKVMALLLSLVMVLAMSIATFATETTSVFTITAPDNGHTYEVYQIFKGTLEIVNGQNILKNLKWGKNGKGGTEDSEVNSTILADLEAVTGDDTAKLAVITKYVNLTATNKFGVVTSAAPLTNVPAGYYLIKDVDGAFANADDSYTKYIVEVVDNVAISPKSDKPTVEKKVQENVKYNVDGGYGTQYNDTADYSIGDAVPFRLIGKVPNTAQYKTYKYTFHDTLSKSFNAPTEASVSVYVASNKAGSDKLPVTKGFKTTVTTAENGTTTITVSTEDLKKIEYKKGADETTVGVNEGQFILVEYTAVLNENAYIESDCDEDKNGNINEVYLSYSNNPNQGGEGEEGKTPEDKVIVFTYKLNAEKVDGKTKEELAGVSFKLYKKLENDAKVWAIVTNGKLSGWTTTEADVAALTSDANGKFSVAGLDDGTYYLKEVQGLPGYNSIPDIKVTISAETHNGHNGNGAVTELGDITLKVDDSAIDGDTVTIENNKGSNLPSTGGMGTTIFYVVGSILVLGAAILLITKKRMSAR